MSLSSKHSAIFSPEAVASINRAYLQALEQMGSEAKQDVMRAQLAANVMALAKSGETDEERLCSLAIVRTLSDKPCGGSLYTGL